MADHVHDHSHPHDHAHAHDHHHHEGDTYFIDQLCMVGLSGAFGVICLCLWFWYRVPTEAVAGEAVSGDVKPKMLNLMLGPQFHIYVVLSGLVLVILAAIRGVILWRQSRDPAFVQAHEHHHHDHAHHHQHDHKHEHAVQEKTPLHGVAALPMTSCGHEHAPGESCGHGHHHHHDHDEADHDHGWAPWRYVVVLVPIILFLLGLPNKGPTIATAAVIAGLPIETEAFPHAHGFDEKSAGAKMTKETHLQLLMSRSIGFGTDRLTQIVHMGAALSPPATGRGEYVDYKVLESLAGLADRRAAWKNRVVEVRGQFANYPGTQQVFMLARYKISCCANDAVQLNVPMIALENVSYPAGEWVKVKGRVDFMEERNGAFRTVLRVAKASDVEKCAPDPNPYIQ